MLKTINIMLHETGMDRNGPMVAGEGRTVTELAAIRAVMPDESGETLADTTVLTPLQELAVDAMAYVQNAVLAKAGDTGRSLPVLTESMRTGFMVLSVMGVDRVKTMYGEAGRDVPPFHPDEAVKMVRRFCEEVVRFTRMSRCLADPIKKDLRAMIGKAGGRDVTVEDLFGHGCMPEDVPAFTQDDVDRAVERYEKEHAAGTPED